MALPERREQLVLLLDYALACGARPLIIGNGTNLLVADQGLDRLVIDTSSALNRTGPGEQPSTVMAEAGATLARVADFACRQGLTGLEFAHGIPGTVGGAVCMNAGAYGGEMKQVIQEAAVFFPQEGVRFLTAEKDGFWLPSQSSHRPAGGGSALCGVSPGTWRAGGDPGRPCGS